MNNTLVTTLLQLAMIAAAGDQTPPLPQAQPMQAAAQPMQAATQPMQAETRPLPQSQPVPAVAVPPPPLPQAQPVQQVQAIPESQQVPTVQPVQALAQPVQPLPQPAQTIPNALQQMIQEMNRQGATFDMPNNDKSVYDKLGDHLAAIYQNSTPSKGGKQ